MKPAIELAREAGFEEWITADHLDELEKLITLTRADMVDELVKGAGEPVMIYHGKCTIDCGEHGHHDMEMLRLIPTGTKLYTPEAVAAAVVQAKQQAIDEYRAELLAGAGEPVAWLAIDAVDGEVQGAMNSEFPPLYTVPVYTAEAIAAAVAQRDQRIADLESQLAAARQDAQRYRWLVASHWYVGPEPDGDLEGVSWSDHNNTANGVTQAIDAAIRAAGGHHD